MRKSFGDLAAAMMIREATVARVDRLTGGYFLLVLESPEQAGLTRPGQFYMLGRPFGELAQDPLLNRPISALDVRPGPSGEPRGIGFLIKEVGRGTRLLGRLRAGERLLCHGPLGRAFPEPAAGARLALVGGGVGIAPLFYCAREWRRRAAVTLFYGGRLESELPLAGEFRAMELAGLHLTTEDGSLGAPGLVTASLSEFMNQDDFDLIYTCGPNPMMETVCRIADGKGVPVWVSMENRMGCGLGACLGCAIPVQVEDGTAMQRVCREGPVFEGRRIAWASLC
jgi:dihydroorotate dehydrogenase electron transfer subunit